MGHVCSVGRGPCSGPWVLSEVSSAGSKGGSRKAGIASGVLADGKCVCSCAFVCIGQKEEEFPLKGGVCQFSKTLFRAL